MTNDTRFKLRAVFLAAMMFLWLFAGTVAFAGGAAAQSDATVTFEDQDQVIPVDNVLVDEYDDPDNDADTLAVWNLTDDDEPEPDTLLGQVDADDEGDTDVTVDFDAGNEFNDSQTLVAVLHDTGTAGAGANGTNILDDDLDNGTDSAFITAIDPDEQGEAVDDPDQVYNFWQGQILVFEGDFIAGEEYDLREANREGQDFFVGGLEREVRANTDGILIVRSSRLDGNYVLEDRDNPISNGDRIGSNLSDFGGYSFEVNEQRLDVDHSGGQDRVTVTQGGEVEVDIDSNRAGYDLDVIADDGNDTTTIETLEDVGDFEEDVAVNIPGDLDPGDYELRFEVVDTDAENAVDITVREEADVDFEFDIPNVQQERGDIVTLDAEVQGLDGDETVTFEVGSEDINWNATVEVSPDEDGDVNLQWNTYLTGDRTDDSTDNDAGTFMTDTGNIESVNIESEISRVVDAELYDVIASVDGEEEDVAVVDLQERSTGDMTLWTSPNADFNDLDNKDNIYSLIDDERIVEGNTSAIADRDRDANRLSDTIVHQVEASGVYGAAYNGSQDLDNGTASLGHLFAEEYVSLEIAQANPQANRDAKVLTIDDEASFDAAADTGGLQLVTDDENNTMFVALRPHALDDLFMNETGRPVETRDEYDVQFNVTGEFQNQFLRSRDAVDEDGSDDQSVEDAFSMTDRELEFETVDDEIRVSPVEGAEITADTTVAPGTEMTVRTRATGESPFLKTNTARVDTDGQLMTEFDFADVEAGQEFTASVRSQSFDNDATTDGVVMEEDFAEVEISDQEAEETGDSVTVDRVFVPQGGFVTIHDDTLLDGEVFDSVRGTSEYLDEGEHTDVEVMLDEPYDIGDHTVIAMPHMDTNDNEEYDFVETEGEEDGPYTDEDGEAIVDDATLSVVEEETPTPTEEETPTPTEAPMDDDGDDEPPADDDDQTGFGAVIALIALLAAALIAARRHSFDN